MSNNRFQTFVALPGWDGEFDFTALSYWDQICDSPYLTDAVIAAVIKNSENVFVIDFNFAESSSSAERGVVNLEEFLVWRERDEPVTITAEVMGHDVEEYFERLREEGKMFYEWEVATLVAG